MLDPRLTSHLDRHGIPYCLIGGLALAAWGVARYTADADLLSLDARILDNTLWSAWGTEPPKITKGDIDDPLGGVVRFPGPPRQDLILGRGAAARIALETSERSESFPCPVASPLGLILLKLEAGSPQDAADILALLGNAQALGRPSLEGEVASMVSQLTHEARAFWVKISVF
ncbi:MAG: hypothetical protein Q8K67_12345 [Geothrix sp.]|nr:hypothetical protein [Geothrix sp.]